MFGGALAGGRSSPELLSDLHSGYCRSSEVPGVEVEAQLHLGNQVEDIISRATVSRGASKTQAG